MRVLLAHNYYRSHAPSGEDVVFHNERELLQAKGIDVISFERHNDEIDESTLAKRLRVGLDSAWSKSTYEELSRVIRRTRPSLAHFHNTFPLLSPSAYAACRDHGVPVVQTLHNYRLICPGGSLNREGRPCEACVGTHLLPALRHRCYRASLPATSAVVWMLARNRMRGTYQYLVNRYVALTRFAASRLLAGGLPEDRMDIKCNFLPNAPEPGAGDGRYAVYAGRLSHDKGVRTLLDAWRYVDRLPLRILGEGPLRQELQSQAKREGLVVDFLGFCRRETVFDVVGRAAVQIVPSILYEGFPMVVLEAYARGTPVIASRIGSLDEIVVDGETGAKFEPGNAHDLADKVNAVMADGSRLAATRHRTRAVFEEKYTAEHNYPQLLAIYERARADFERAARSATAP